MLNGQVALALARAGFAVFPCQWHGEDVKKPLRGLYWRKLSSTDLKTVERWWEQNPEALPAIDLAKCGLLVVDCDAPKRGEVDGVTWFGELTRANGLDLTTVPGAKTLSGGRHAYFRQPDGTALTNARGALPARKECGIDIRGAGGYVIAPGASLAGGRKYEAIRDLGEVSTMPAWLVALLRGDQAQRKSPANGVTPPVQDSDQGQRKSTPSDTFFRAVNDLALANLSRWVGEVFGSAARSQPSTGTYRVSSKALGRNLEEDLSLAPTGIIDFGVHDMGDSRQGRRTAIDVVMEHGRAADAKTAALWLCERLGRDPEALGFDGARPELVAIGAAVARNLIEEKDGTIVDRDTGEIVEAEVPAEQGDNPFGPDWDQFVLRGDPARTVGLIGELIEWICATSLRPNRPLAMAAAISIVGAAASRQMVGPTHSSPHLYIACLGETSIGKARPMKAIAQVLTKSGLGALVKTGKFKSDTSIELMIEGCPVAVAIVDEIGSNLFAKMTNRRASTHESTISAVLRELWSVAPGDIFSTSARAGQATRTLDSPILSIFGVSTIQEFYRSLSGNTIENGFLNRFTMIRAAARTEEREPTADPHVVPERIIARLRNILPPDVPGALPGLQSMIGLHAPANVLKVPFADVNAKELYRAFSNRLLRWGDENTAMEAFIGRTAEMAIRLATVHAIGDGGRQAAVSEEDFQWGATISLSSAGFMIVDAAANMAENDYQAKFKMVQDIIRKERRISRETLYRRVDGRMDAKQLDGILSALETANQIVTAKDGHGSKAGRPKLTYVHGGIA